MKAEVVEAHKLAVAALEAGTPNADIDVPVWLAYYIHSRHRMVGLPAHAVALHCGQLLAKHRAVQEARFDSAMGRAAAKASEVDEESPTVPSGDSR